MDTNSTDDAAVEVPQYRCHKVVRAAKITGFRGNGSGYPDLVLGEIGGVVTLLPDWHEKNKPQVGGYYVMYDDGYISYSPAKAFEEGYTLIRQQATEGAIERMLAAKGKTAPRLSPADLDANVVHTEIVRHVSPSGQVLRWAVLTTLSGFAVTGKPSAAVSAANDDTEIGERVAIENARAELWPLMGYALKQRLHEEA